MVPLVIAAILTEVHILEIYVPQSKSKLGHKQCKENIKIEKKSDPKSGYYWSLEQYFTPSCTDRCQPSPQKRICIPEGSNIGHAAQIQMNILTYHMHIEYISDTSKLA